MRNNGFIVVFYEDRYGKEFLTNIFTQLKVEALIPSCKIKFQRLDAECNEKITRKIQAVLTYRDVDGVLVIIDDDRTSGIKHNKLKQHIPRKYPLPIKVLIFEDEIEELILFANNEKYTGKASNHLKSNKGYKKKHLAQYRLEISNIQDHPVIKGCIDFICMCLSK